MQKNAFVNDNKTGTGEDQGLLLECIAFTYQQRNAFFWVM